MPTIKRAAINISTEFVSFVIMKNIPATIDMILPIIIAPFLPTLSANHEPPNEPVAPPTRNIETTADHKMLISFSDNIMLYLLYMLSLQKSFII